MRLKFTPVRDRWISSFVLKSPNKPACSEPHCKIILSCPQGDILPVHPWRLAFELVRPMIFVGGKFKAQVSPPFADFIICGFLALVGNLLASGRNGLASWMTATAKEWLSLKVIVAHNRCVLSVSKDESACLLLDTCAPLSSRGVWNANKESKICVQLPRNSIRALSSRREIHFWENWRQSRTPTTRKVF